MDALESWAAVANDAANIGWLLAAAVLLLVMAAIGVAALRRRTLRMRQRQTPAIAHRDPIDEFIESALRYDRDQRRLRGEDLHDVFPEEER